MSSVVAIAALVLTALAGVGAGIWIRRASEGRRIREGRSRAEELVRAAERDAEATRKTAALEAREEFVRRKEEFDKESQTQRRQVEKLERALGDREAGLNRRTELLDRREGDLDALDQRLDARRKEIEEIRSEASKLVDEHRAALERLSGLTAEEAKEELRNRLLDDARLEVARKVKELKESSIRTAESEAKKIIALAITRLASEVSAENTVSVVALPSDEMKGRIIGREGRNIRAFENLTGIDVIIDDTPEAVVLSCFDPVRREIGRIALERLISDGRIHPTRIEEIVEKAKRDVDKTIREAAEKACLDLGISGVKDEVLQTLGRLRYRTSYGQNILHHSVDVAFLCGMMASELGFDPAVARRSGLFHDIGKAVDHEVEGPHAEIGANILRRHGESQVVCEAVGAHHDDAETMPSIYPVLVQAADAISGARPGARRETLASYIKRLERLENIARESSGVSNAYAIQAGREIRVMVDAAKVNDAAASHLTIDLARRIEKELDYPGMIRVVVIREFRSVEYAK